jgi:hypothetical protein
MRGRLTFAALALAAALSGCGGKFTLPSEVVTRPTVATEKSYAMLQTWTGMDGIRDILITQGAGSQMFMVFNTYPEGGAPTYHGGYGNPATTSFGHVSLYPFASPHEVGGGYFTHPLHLFAPVAVAVGQNALFVLDQGDSCEAKWDEARQTCEADPTPLSPDTSVHHHHDIVRDYSATWRVRLYPLSGGDTLSQFTSFTDTSFAKVYGIAVDEQFVYVSGIAAILDTSRTNTQDRTRKFASRIYRYARGPRYPGITPSDINMPGADWHRDSTWLVLDGTGTSSVSDPRGIALSQVGVPTLLVADRGNNEGKTMSSVDMAVGFTKFDARETGATFDGPEDAAMDRQGFSYIVDRNNKRVTRHDASGAWIQNINIENNEFGQPLLDPVTVGVDDSLAYVGDRGRGQVIRYKRRS